MTRDKGGRWWRRLLILPPLVVGLALVIGAAKIKKSPEKAAQLEKPVPVRVMKAMKMKVVPITRGYGIARPARQWQAVSRVAGPLAFVHPNLKSGAFIKAGELLIAIEPSEYQLGIEQIDAELNASKVKAANSKELLKIEARNNALLQADLERKLTLKKQGAVSQSSIDTATRALLGAQSRVQGFKNTISQLAAEQKVLITRRANASLSLARTRIIAPFDLRVTEVLTETAQYANKGQVLMKADGVEAAEITAHIPMGRLRFLVRGTGGAGWLLGTAQGKKTGPLRLKAKVLARRPHGTVSWPARVSRIAQSLDAQTQTVGIVVQVDNPYAKAVPGVRPLLVPNTFVEVELRGKALENQIVVPASALHQGKIYVVNSDKRLKVRQVKVKFRQGSFVVIAKGLDGGEKIVLSDLIPAIDGMLLKPKGDKKTLQTLKLEAQGKKTGGKKTGGRQGGKQ